MFSLGKGHPGLCHHSRPLILLTSHLIGRCSLSGEIDPQALMATSSERGDAMAASAGGTKDDRSQPSPKVYMTGTDRDILVLGAYLVLLTVIGIVFFIQLLMADFPTAGGNSDIRFLFFSIHGISAEVRLMLLVVVSGALGGLLRALNSFARYLGARQFVRSWITHYYFQPLVGATLGVIFYVVIRGGFFAPGTSTADVSELGFVALSALVGLFNGQAMEKLKDIATVIFKSAKGEDSLEDSGSGGGGK